MVLHFLIAHAFMSRTFVLIPKLMQNNPRKVGYTKNKWPRALFFMTEKINKKMLGRVCIETLESH